MKRLFAITVVTLLSSAMFLVVVCAAGPPIPTIGTWKGTTTTGAPTGSCLSAGGVALISAEGKGVASPWGAGSWVGDPTCLFILIPAGSYVDGKQVFQGSGTATITSANGDEIYLEEVFTLVGNLVAPPPPRQTLKANGHKTSILPEGREGSPMRTAMLFPAACGPTTMMERCHGKERIQVPSSTESMFQAFGSGGAEGAEDRPS